MKDKMLKQLQKVSRKLGIKPEDWIVSDLDTWEKWAEKRTKRYDRKLANRSF